ncbi:MAG: lipoprotein-releasing ABC transporter ATP-binding protein LolD [Gammaproteobacteria bacterium]|nr:lipoprotein-releasing ABC transporter ATP-binding protein LolD [Gammaproteobacteria bacterium]
MSTHENPIVLRCNNLSRSFSDAGQELEVLSNVSLEIKAGESLAIIGRSGAGKTTLLQLLGGLDLPDEGTVEVAGKDLAKLSNKERGVLRNEALGFVYQFHHLLPEFTALENVAMPLLMRRDPVSKSIASATKVLGRVGLQDRLTHRPGELSGGERQRAAVARALVTQPAVILADEPTGNLDEQTGETVFELMLELNQESGASLIVVTHDLDLAARMDRIVELDQGQLKPYQGGG